MYTVRYGPLFGSRQRLLSVHACLSVVSEASNACMHVHMYNCGRVTCAFFTLHKPHRHMYTLSDGGEQWPTR